jgi:hypothetical protein
MRGSRPTSEKWLSREDKVCQKDRLGRLDWLAEQLPTKEHLTFHGGLMSKFLYEEARYSFVYGQFLAAIVLGLAFIEHTLAALFYAAGRNDMERPSIAALFREALNLGLISQAEFDGLERARRIRNPVTHFRRPLQEDTVDYRAAVDNELPYDLIEEDARHVMKTVMHLLAKQTI